MRMAVCSLLRFPFCVAAFVYAFSVVIQANWHWNSPCCSHVSLRQTGSTELVLDSTRPKKPHPLLKMLDDQSRAKTLVNIGVTFEDLTEIFKCNSGGFLEPRRIKRAGLYELVYILRRINKWQSIVADQVTVTVGHLACHCLYIFYTFNINIFLHGLCLLLWSGLAF